MGRRGQGRTSEVVNIREILRLTAAGLNQTQIAQSCRTARSTVQDYQRRAKAAGVDYEIARELPDDDLLRLLGKGGERRERKPCDLDYPAILRDAEVKGVTLMLLWQEHVLQAGIDLSYGEFCKRVRARSLTQDCVMRQTHAPGDKLFVDYTGLKIACLDRETGERRFAEVFVAALGASSFAYAEATPDQTLPSWLGSTGGRLLSNCGKLKGETEKC